MVSLWKNLAYHHLGPLRLASPLLIPVSVAVSVYARLRRTLYQKDFFRRFAFPVPIICVGNLTVGGVGKTPLTIFLARTLQQSGYKPAILTRGYGRKSSKPVLLTPDTFSMDRILNYGDEAALLYLKTGCPVAIGGDRVQSVETLLRDTDCSVVLMDDGFQHLRLRRDIDLLVMNPENPYGNGYCLPYGPLREPCSAHGFADAIFLNGQDATAGTHTGKIPSFSGHLSWTALQPFEDWIRQDESGCVLLKKFRGCPVNLLSGVGSPDRIRDDALRLEMIVNDSFVYPDHHWFSIKELETIQEKAIKNPILTTEKDAVRLIPLQQWLRENYPHIYVIRTDWTMTSHEQFIEWFGSRLSTIPKATSIE
jgi:tetraacyldisaccharide 4'-kinase